MAAIGLEVNGAFHQDSPLATQLQVTLNLLPAHAWYAMPNGGLTFVNGRSADYHGLSQDHPLRSGQNTGADWDFHIPLLHPDDHEETRRVWSNCLSTGLAGEVCFRVANAEGRYRWFLSRAEPVRAANGSLLYWIGVNFDIDDQKRAQQELRDIVDSIPTIVWVASPDGSNTQVNIRYQEYSGAKPSQTAGSG
jgi:PAS domain S-box-containing protein